MPVGAVHCFLGSAYSVFSFSYPSIQNQIGLVKEERRVASLEPPALHDRCIGRIGSGKTPLPLRRQFDLAHKIYWHVALVTVHWPLTAAKLSATMAFTWARASGILSASLPPAVARFLRPPPPPPVTAATCLTIRLASSD